MTVVQDLNRVPDLIRDGVAHGLEMGTGKPDWRASVRACRKSDGLRSGLHHDSRPRHSSLAWAPAAADKSNHFDGTEIGESPFSFFRDFEAGLSCT